MLKHLLTTSLIVLGFICGCDKDTDPASRVQKGQSAVHDAEDAVAKINGRTPDPATLSRKITEAENLLQAGQTSAARTLVDQITPQKDLLTDVDKTRLEEISEKLAQ